MGRGRLKDKNFHSGHRKFVRYPAGDGEPRARGRSRDGTTHLGATSPQMTLRVKLVYETPSEESIYTEGEPSKHTGPCPETLQHLGVGHK